MRASLELNKVVLLGRTFDEYVRYFGLQPKALRGQSILDIASGVSSFCAEGTAQGLEVMALDPIYEMSAEEIQNRCEPDLDYVTAEIGKVAAYKWDFYKTPEGMRAYREHSYRSFLPHFRQAKGKRYISGRLPATSFRDRQFHLSLVSYFLFVYEDQLNYEFHKQSLTEILRITSDEARIYPLVNFKAQRSTILDRIKEEPDFADWEFEEVSTDFEFLRNSNAYLRIARKPRLRTF